MKGICFAPEFDEPTEYSYKWNERLRDQIGDRMEKILLLKSDALRNNLEQALKENPDAILIHYDHGSEDAIYGQDGNPAIDLNNVILLKGRIAYNMNCLSAKILGKVAYEDGCKAYWGSVEVVSFTTDAEEEFCRAFNFGLLYWLEGHSWKETLEETKREMTKIIDELVKQGNGMAAMLLREDRDALVCYDESPPPQETCPVSRMIVSAFGFKTLTRLRRLRSRIFG